MRLQLYQPYHRSRPSQLEVYTWYKAGARVPYSSTLYVTLKGIVPPDNVEPAARSMFPTQRVIRLVISLWADNFKCNCFLFLKSIQAILGSAFVRACMQCPYSMHFSTCHRSGEFRTLFSLMIKKTLTEKGWKACRRGNLFFVQIDCTLPYMY